MKALRLERCLTVSELMIARADFADETNRRINEALKETLLATTRHFLFEILRRDFYTSHGNGD